MEHRPAGLCGTASGDAVPHNATRPCQENSRCPSRGVARPWRPRHRGRCRACNRAWPARSLVLRGCAQDAVQSRLIALSMQFEPVEHIDIETHRDLLLRRWPGLGRLLEKRGIQRWDLRIVDVPILQPVKLRQVAFDKFPAHVGSPFSWR